MLEDSLEVPRDLLADLTVEVLTHYGDFLRPANGQLVGLEILDHLGKKVGPIESGHKRLSFITELHPSLYGVPCLLLR